MADRPRAVPHLLAYAAFLAVVAVSSATPARGFGLADVGTLALGAFAIHALALSPGLFARDPRAGVVAIAMLLAVVPSLRSGALVNERALSLVLLALAAAASGALARSVSILRPSFVAILGLLGLTGAAGRALDGPQRGAAPGDRAPVESPPDVFLVTIDTLRADHVGSGADGGARTPTLHGIAANGARFTRAYATAPLTGPSHTAMFTGRWPLTTGVVSNGTPVGDHPELLARRFRDAGYATIASVGGFPLTSRFGLSQGFDVFADDLGTVRGLHELPVVQLLDLLHPTSFPRERRADAVIDDAIAGLDRVGPARPVFAWIHLFDPHAPYEAPGVASPSYDGDWRARAATDPAAWKAAYLDEIAYTDAELARWLRAIDTRTAARNAIGSRAPLVMVVSDHGESLGEHGVFFDHGDDLYDPSLHVPWLVSGPGIAPGTVIDAHVSTVDVAPTLLALAGLKDDFARDGTSRAADLRGQIGPDEPALATTLGGRHRDPPLDHALRTRDAKCYARHDVPAVLYLASDPTESTDASATSPELFRATCGALAAAARHASGLPIAASDDVDAQLRALGYLQ